MGDRYGGGVLWDTGTNHKTTATAINNLAFFLKEKGQYDEAEALYRGAL